MVKRIRIFHTNDLHSHFEIMPKIAHFFKRMRRECREAGDEALFVDLGDHIDRMRMKSEASRGRANLEILEKSGYHLITLGNNEGITFTKKELDHLYSNASIPVVLGNLLEKGKKRPEWMVPYRIKTFFEGFRLGFIGLTFPYKEFYRLLDWEVFDPESVLPELLKELRDKVDGVILLSHLGIRKDREIALSFPEIRVILGAHSHHFLPEGERVGETLITQMGRFGEHVGEVIIEIGGGNRILSVKAQAHSMEMVEEDPEVAQLIETYRHEADTILNETVLSLKEPLPVSWEAESPSANLLAQGIRRWTRAEISLVNSGVLLRDLPAGPITLKDLLQICPHPINACRLQLTADQLRIILDDALKQEKMARSVQGFGFRGKILGFPAVDGCEIFYTQTDGEWKVERIAVSGRALHGNETILVGTIDMLLFSKPYEGMANIREAEFFLPYFLRNILGYELKRDGALLEAKRHRYIPLA